MKKLEKVLSVCGFVAIGIVAAIIIIGIVFSIHTPAFISKNLDDSATTEPHTTTSGFGEVPGTAGRLHFPGTDIDGEVMIAADNEYFLRRDEQGNEDVWGCYFMDYECHPESKNLIVYGHSLEDSPDGQRFSQLKRLEDAAFAENNNRVYLTVHGTTHEYEIFSHGNVPAEDDSIVIAANPADADMRDIIAGAIERSIHDYNTEVTEEDKLLTLFTCTSDPEQRFVVVAKRL